MNDELRKQSNSLNGKWISGINWTAAVLVAFVAIFAFILSYSSLRHLADNNGVGRLLSYAWPLLLDFAMVVFSLAILRAYLRQEKPVYPWILTIAFASLATLANILDASTLDIDPKIIRAGVKALAPITLVLAFELLMGMLRAEVKRKEEVVTIKELAANANELTEEIAGLTGKRDRLQRQIGTLEDAKSGAKTTPISANTQDKKAQNVRALLAHYAKNPQSSYTQAANEIGVSRQTVANYLDELEGDGAIHRNGQGVQVLSLEVDEMRL